MSALCDSCEQALEWPPSQAEPIPDMPKPVLLAIVELGGYPDFRPLYTRLGCEVLQETTMRKALSVVKKRKPRVIVAEFNFQSDFRDRTSTLETLQAVVQRLPDTRVIVFYEQEFQHQLARLEQHFQPFRSMPFPIDESELEDTVQAALAAG